LDMKRTRLFGTAAVAALLSIGFAPPALAARATSPSTGAWQVVTSPNPDSSNNALDAVAVVSANDVWAVGRADSKTLAEHWDGASGASWRRRTLQRATTTASCLG